MGKKPLPGYAQDEGLERGQGRENTASQLSLGHRDGDSEPVLSPEPVHLLHWAPPGFPFKLSLRLTPSQGREAEEAVHLMGGETEA